MKTLDFEPRFIQLATSINGSMPRYTMDRIAGLLNENAKPLNGSRILILGLAYKPNTSDYRESPSIDVMELLLEAKAQVSYHDPFVPQIELSGRKYSSVSLTDQALSGADCVVILTAHKDMDYARVARVARCVFDARNATAGIERANIQRL